MSYHCSECDVNWHADQADQGRCPTCGGGVAVRGPETAGYDADILYRIAHDEAATCDAYARFELYYDERDLDVASPEGESQ